MKHPLSDTHPKAEEELVKLIRKARPWEKYAQVNEIIKACRQLTWAGLKMRHPNAPEEELQKRFASLCLPRELVIKIYNWDPDKEGY